MIPVTLVNLLIDCSACKKASKLTTKYSFSFNIKSFIHDYFESYTSSPEFDIKPGDVIEWVFENDGQLVDENETFWSSIEKNHVPIGSKFIHMCILYDNKKLAWLNELGLFEIDVHSDVNELLVRRMNFLSRRIPRKRKL